MREASALMTLAGLGAVVLLLGGVRDRLLLAWSSLLAGTGVVTILLLLAALVGLPQRQWHIAFVALLLAGLGVGLQRADGGSLRRAPWAAVAGVVAVHGLLAAALHQTRAVRVTPDSFEYLNTGSLIARTGDHLEVPLRWLLTRGLTLPTVHGLAGEDFYLGSFAPALAVATLLALWWAGRELLQGTVPVWAVRAVLTAGLLLVVTNHRAAYNALYVNGHLLFALCALTVVAVPLVRMRTGRPSSGGVVTLLAVALAAVVPLRPEAFVVIAAFLIPGLCARRWPLGERQLVLLAFAAATELHGAVLATAHLRLDDSIPVAALVALATALAAVMVTWLLPLLPGRVLARGPALVTAALAVVLAAAAMLRPALFAANLEATRHNALLGQGLWGSSLWLLGAAVVTVMVLRRWPGQWTLFLPILWFAAISLILAMGPRGAYRIGPGDSLNRMWLHVVPIAVLLLVTSAGSVPRLGRAAAGGGAPPVVDGEAAQTGSAPVEQARP